MKNKSHQVDIVIHTKGYITERGDYVVVTIPTISKKSRVEVEVE